MDRKTVTFFLVIFIACALWLTACAGAPASQAPATTDLLLQAGFQARPPVKPDHISTLPANQFAVTVLLAPNDISTKARRI